MNRTASHSSNASMSLPMCSAYVASGSGDTSSGDTGVWPLAWITPEAYMQLASTSSMSWPVIGRLMYIFIGFLYIILVYYCIFKNDMYITFAISDFVSTTEKPRIDFYNATIAIQFFYCSFYRNSTNTIKHFITYFEFCFHFYSIILQVQNRRQTHKDFRPIHLFCSPYKSIRHNPSCLRLSSLNHSLCKAVFIVEHHLFHCQSILRSCY